MAQVPTRGRGGRGQGAVQGRGQVLSMDRGHRRQVHGRPQPGYSRNSGYSDTEMLSEMGDSWAAERHRYSTQFSSTGVQRQSYRQRLDRLRLERDHGSTATPGTGERLSFCTGYFRLVDSLVHQEMGKFRFLWATQAYQRLVTSFWSQTTSQSDQS